MAQNYPSLGQRIRMVRKLRGWDQITLSEVSGVPKTTIGEWELGNRLKAIEQFVRLCDALELLPGDILDCDSAYYPSRLKMLDATFWGVGAAAMKQGLELPEKGVQALDDAAS